MPLWPVSKLDVLFADAHRILLWSQLLGCEHVRTNTQLSDLLSCAAFTGLDPMAMLATTNTFSSSSHVTARRRMICAIKKLVPFCSSELSQNKSPVKRWIFDHATPKKRASFYQPDAL